MELTLKKSNYIFIDESILIEESFLEEIKKYVGINNKRFITTKKNI